MNRFRKKLDQEVRPVKRSTNDNDPFNQLRECKDKLKDISDTLKNLSNKL